MNKKINLIKYTGILFLLLVPSFLVAQESTISFSYWGIDFYPYLRGGMSYVDNIYSTKEKKGDFLFTLNPGLTVKLPWRRQAFQIDYNLDFKLFTKYTFLNHTNVAVSGVADLNLDNYSFNIEKGYREYYGVITYVEDYAKGVMNMDKLLFTAGFHLFSFDFGWQNISYDYQLSKKGRNYDAWDRNAQAYTFTGYLKLYPKTSLLGEYCYGQIKYPYRPGREAKYHLFLTGVKGDLTAKISGLVRLGYQIRDYQTLNDWQGLSLQIDLNKKFSAVTELNLSLERAVNESEFTDKNYYLLNGIVINLTQHLPEFRLNTTVSLSLHNEIYPQTQIRQIQREDNLFGYSISIGYKFWKLPISSLTYQYTERNSNFNEYDYNTQTISLSMRGLF